MLRLMNSLIKYSTYSINKTILFKFELQLLPKGNPPPPKERNGSGRIVKVIKISSKGATAPFASMQLRHGKCT